jgi:16S rRNA (cytosine967-C5)-methyltransferase
VTPQARAQAAIEILDQVIAAARDEGPPADSLVTTYFKTRRYAGSKDRRAVRELVFAAIRHSADRPESGRAALLPFAGELFDGSPHGPVPVSEGESGAEPGIVPAWLLSELSPLVAVDRTLIERAPLDLRAKPPREPLLAEFPDAQPTRLSPWGLRLSADSRVTDHPAYLDGRVEVQDEGSQLIALACAPRDGELLIDLCAGAGGKSLALAAAAPGAEIIACDTNRQRLSRLQPRALRAGALMAVRLLDVPREAEALSDLRGRCDLVLVDAPCSGSGTWRRNPEGRWRMSPERLERLLSLQARVLDLAAPLVKPGGRLVYAVCSLLSREGAGQAEQFLSRHSAYKVEDTRLAAGRFDGAGTLLTPGHDGTDGFYIARFGLHG